MAELNGTDSTTQSSTQPSPQPTPKKAHGWGMTNAQIIRALRKGKK
jgi:hypothetical protein